MVDLDAAKPVRLERPEAFAGPLPLAVVLARMRDDGQTAAIADQADSFLDAQLLAFDETGLARRPFKVFNALYLLSFSTNCS